jgi:quinol monooxygenase YgiN
VQGREKFSSGDPFRFPISSLVRPNERKHPMTTKPVTLINVMKVQAGMQAALIVLLQENVEKVITTLDGWRTTRLIAAQDGASIIIYSEWDTPAAIEAMRSDPRMQAYFPRILEMATVDSTIGEAVFTAGP